MSCLDATHCNDEQRRADVIVASPPLNGIEAVEIIPKPDADPLVQRVLAIYFFHGIPVGLNNANLDKFQITGGVRVPGESIRMVDVQSVAGHLELTVDRSGDFSDYVLTIDHPDLDPLYRCRRFNFKVDCPNPFDCERPQTPPATPPTGPPIDYQTKDYRSFRRALLDFLPTRVPGFDETNEADLAVTLAELFAYAGDQLSYYQDAVANEAYLGTARQRLSVKRHARLVDYRMHDGAAARTVLYFKVNSPVTIGAGFQVATNERDPSRQRIFETEESASLVQEQNKIPLYTWHNVKCCLPKGATSADLLGKFSSLKIGQLLLLEETLGPVTLQDNSVVLAPGGADLSRRQVVRLTKIDFLTDPLQPSGQRDVTRITWQDADALRFEFCLEAGAVGPGLATVVRGNLLRASDGVTVANESVDPVKLRLAQGPLTWLNPIDDGPLTWLVPPDTVDPRAARSTIQLQINGELWNEQESLLDSGPNDPDFVVDTDDQGRGLLRFGDGELGRQLPPGATLIATYRVGNGGAGNVGEGALSRQVLPNSAVNLVRNPLPASGGIDREPIVNVQRDAPQGFRAIQYRAVTTNDYATAAKSVKGVSSGAATCRWTGSWLTVFDAIDAAGRTDLPASLKQAVIERLGSWRQAGYDLEIVPPIYVPLDIELRVCVLPEYFRADVLRAVADALASGLRFDGTLGFFHPDRFTFGQSLYLSQLYAAVQGVPGVRSVEARIFKRLNRPDYHELQAGRLTIGPFEIVRLDNDRSQPDNGILVLSAEGGK